MPKKLAVFGCGSDLSTNIEQLKKEFEIVAIFDNNAMLHGEEKYGFEISRPQKILSFDFDVLKICSLANSTKIRTQVIDLGVPEEKIMPTALWCDQNFSKWSKLRSQRKRERAFIIGNGPSLTLEDLKLLHLNNESCFAFNKIYLAFEESNFRPTYYIVEDTLVAQNNAQKIDALSGFPKFYPEHLLRTLKISNDVLVFGHNLPNPNKEIATRPSSCPKNFGWGASVTCTAIQAAFYLGFSKIHLLGVDFNFDLPKQECDQNGVLTGQGEINHFHKDYRPCGEKWNVPKMDITSSHYLMLLEFADKMGIEIINSTRGGKLEIFPRVSLERALA